MNYLNRRDFLRLAGITAGGIAVSSIPDLGKTPLALSATQEADFQLFSPVEHGRVRASSPMRIKFKSDKQEGQQVPPL